MATITVRALDPVTRDPLQGSGQNNFISDLDAVSQIILTRMLLFEGEWYLNLLDGLPMFQQILGSSGGSTNIQLIINLISQRIKGTPYVTSIGSIVASYLNRQLKWSAEVYTQFGKVYVTNAPGNNAVLTGSS